jgi:hypothetical protein
VTRLQLSNAANNVQLGGGAFQMHANVRFVGLGGDHITRGVWGSGNQAHVYIYIHMCVYVYVEARAYVQLD